MNKLSELIVYLKKKGLKETISRIKFRYFSITEFVLLSCDISKFEPTMESNPDIEYKFGDMNVLEEYRRKYIELPREFYVDQTHGAKEFYLGYYKGELAEICWVFRKGEYSRFFAINDEAVCELNYIITLPQFRGKGLPAHFVDYMFTQLKHQNIDKVVIGVSANNVNIIKAMKHTGFCEFKRVKSYLSILAKTKI